MTFSFIQMPGVTSLKEDAKDNIEEYWKKAAKKMEDNGEDDMDEVDPKQAKKKFKDRKDKDIDNDGDVDSSDKFLHKRRKAIAKSSDTEDEPEGESGETATMNPKVSDKPKKKESKIREALLSVVAEKKQGNHDNKDNWDDKYKGDGAKKMKADHMKGDVDDTEKLGHDDAAAAGRAGPSKKPRHNDSKIGDKQIINRVAKAYKEMKENDNGKETADTA